MWAQSPAYHLTYLNGERGLSESHVFAIMQDKKGFMWFGTRDGLNRFDGYDIKIYRNDPEDPQSISSSYIYSIYQDPEGILWVGTRGGLNRFEQADETFTSFKHQPENPLSLSHDTIYEIKPGAGPTKGQLWIATANGGLNLFDPKTGQFQAYRHNPKNISSMSNDAVRCMVIEPDGDVWAGTEEGLNYMKADEPGVFRRYISDPNQKNSLRHNKVVSLYYDHRGTLWIGSEQGLEILDSSGVFTRLKTPSGESFGNTIFVSGDGKDGVWIGASHHGVFHHPLGTNNFKKYQIGINPDGFRSMYRDRNDTLWLGFYGNGVVHMTPTAFVRQGRDEDEVSALLKDSKGGLWIGKRGSPLEYRGPNGERRLFPASQNPGLDDDTATSLIEGTKGRIWVGGDISGLACYDPAKGQFIPNLWSNIADSHMKQGWIGSTAIDGNGVLWLGTDRGLKSLNLETLASPNVYKPDPSDPFSISATGVPSLHFNPDSPDTLWVGTWNGGLNRMSLSRPGEFIHFKTNPNDPNSLASNGVLAIHEDAHGALWLGAPDGLSRFDPKTHKAISWTMKDGLPSNTIYRILEDKQGCLWLSTPRGLSRFEPKTEKFQNFGRHDGLLVEDFRENCGFRNPDGSMVFGGNGGWIRFDPADIMFYHDPPTTVITDFKLDNRAVGPRRKAEDSPLVKSIEFTDSIQLSYKHRTIEFHFAALHHASPPKNQYAYRLENFDPNWNETDARNRHAIYTNLDAGLYTFRVKGSNKDGVWSDPVSLDLNIPPPPWLTWWAYLLYFLIFLSVIGGYIRSLYHKLERQRLSLEHLREMERMKDAFNRELEDKVEERTRELKGARRKLLKTARAAGMAEIASDVLHNVGNTLNSARTSLHIIQEKVDDDMGLRLLARIAGLFREREDQLNACFEQDMMVRKLPETLERIHARIKENQGIISAEGAMLQQKILSIVASLRKQHEHVHTRSLLLESCNLGRVLDESLESASDMVHSIKCVKRVDKTQRVVMDRLKTHRILLLLIQNAVEAIEEAGLNGEGRIVFTIKACEDGAELEMVDNGVGIGIDVQKHSQLYVHGYSNKQDHEGFGLHYCANAMKEMGGKINISSEGEMRGACVTLSFVNQMSKAGPDGAT